MCKCLFCLEKVNQDKSLFIQYMVDSHTMSKSIVLENVFRCIYDDSSKCYALDATTTIPHMFMHKIIPTYIQVEWHNNDMLKHLTHNDPILNEITLDFNFVSSDGKKISLLKLPLTFALKYCEYKTSGSIMLIRLRFNSFFPDRLESLILEDKRLSYYDLSIYDPKKIFDKVNLYFDWEHTDYSMIDSIKLEYKSLKSFYCSMNANTVHTFEGFDGHTDGIFIELFDELDEEGDILADNNISKIKSIGLSCDGHEIVSLHELRLKFVTKIYTPKLAYIPLFNTESFIDMKQCKIIMGYYSKSMSRVGIHFYINSKFDSDEHTK